MAKVLGYNFFFKFNNKRIAGVTQDDIDIQPLTKESLTKDDQGATQFEVVGHTIDITVAGLIDIDGSGSGSGSGGTKLHADDLIALGLAKGASAKVPCTYVRGGGRAYSGTAVCNGYSESTNAEDFGSFSLKFRISGNLTAATQ